ncbi:hypothetical protein [Streptomyces chrestomyceticus]|uniref:hypothetical protein n=1 Tax=Streptomyces chrestomyceticus TaxID=68185 RepID=UPI0033CACB0E
MIWNRRTWSRQTSMAVAVAVAVAVAGIVDLDGAAVAVGLGVRVLRAAQRRAALATERRTGGPAERPASAGSAGSSRVSPLRLPPVAMATSGDRRDRDTVRFDDQAVLASNLAPAHRNWTIDRPPEDGP